MKKLLAMSLLLLSSLANAQDWHLIQPWHEQYYTNPESIIYESVIDSVGTIGQDSVFYPYRHYGDNEEYGFESHCPSLDAPSWLSGKVVKDNTNGEYKFFAKDSNIALVKTKANLYETWRYYTFDDSNYYTAVVSRVGDTVLFGVADSFKVIHYFSK